MNTPKSIHALILLLFLGLPAITRAQDDAAVASPVTLSTGWLMQDVAQVKDTGDAISKVGYTTPVYLPVPYAPPASASANAPTATVIPGDVRTAKSKGGIAGRGARGNSGLNDTDPKAAATQGASLWPINAEANRPSFSSDWQQAPAPSATQWYQATVPGTVLTTLVDNKIYPDPLYGENNRPNIIPESLCRTSYWYRDEFTVPAGYAGKQVWLNFDGINYFADVWVNGTKAGSIQGAFMRGNFNITSDVKPGGQAAVAVCIIPPPHPGDPWEKTVANQRGPNGGGVSGQLGRDGPTFVASLGWDWVPGIRDRQIGIWQKVTLSATGPVLVENPYVVTDLPQLPSTATADISIEATLQNTSDTPETGLFTGKLDDTTFQSAPITLPPHGAQVVQLSPATNPELRLANPKLWWPNGYGEPNLHPLRLSFDLNGASSDVKELNIGIRKVTYFVDDSKNLTLSVNGVRVYAKGGDWGMDDAMKRIPAQRLDTLVRLHREANYNIIRNWVGQSTSEDFFAACDKYGIMVWDEFFEANPNNGRDPDSPDLYLANVRDTVLRYRNHPSIVIWCGRNEGPPSPPAIADGNIKLLQELDPPRYYQASSTAGNGVISGGPYGWQLPRSYYGNGLNQAFKTEIGSASIPTLEAIQAWMPQKDWFDQNFPNDDWAEHDLVNGAGNPADSALQNVLRQRYGPYASLPEFVRKAQMADYETYRAMYESHLSKMFAPSTALITWMSNPAQPCLVWQIYDYSLEPFASYFAVRKACEPVHVMMTQNNFHAMVANSSPQAMSSYKVRTQIYNLDGAKKYDQTTDASNLAASSATDLGAIPFPDDLSPVHFVKLELRDAAGQLVSDNFYWRETKPDDFTALDTIPDATLDTALTRHDTDGKLLLDVTLTNSSNLVAVMAHLQLRNQRTNERVLPVFYSDNYVSLLPGENKTIAIEAPANLLGADQPLVAVDGWNVAVKPAIYSGNGGAAIGPNGNAIVARPAEYQHIAAAVEGVFKNDIVDKFFPAAEDTAGAGFFQDFAADWTHRPNDTTRSIVYQARLTWLSAQAAFHYPAQAAAYVEESRHGVAELANLQWDKTNGGFYWSVNATNGTPVDDQKHTYGNAFGMYAAAASYSLTHDAAALDLAKREFQWLEDHARDPVHGGYNEALDVTGKPFAADAGRGADALGRPYGQKSMNTHIHALEALTELYQVWPDPAVKTRLEEIFDLNLNKIYSDPGYLILYFNNDWSPATGEEDSYGHNLEAAYLLTDTSKVLGRPDDEKVWRAARNLVDHALQFGWDKKNGGFFEEGALDGSRITKAGKTWWVQAEALYALLLMHERYGHETSKYWDYFVQEWNFIKDHQLDHAHGGWYASAPNNARQGNAPKTDPWTEGYHQGRAMLNVYALLHRLADAQWQPPTPPPVVPVAAQ
jgi:beta-mannosidase